MILIVGIASLEIIWINRILAQAETRTLAYEYITENIPPDSNILIGSHFTYSVPLHRSQESIQRLAATGAEIAPIYEFQLANPGYITGPFYNLFGPEYQQNIVDDATWWEFVRDHNIEFVVEADYCGGQARYDSPSQIEFPVITPPVRAELSLVEIFSPFQSDQCEQIIPDRTALENMMLHGWERVGPLIRIYRISHDDLL